MKIPDSLKGVLLIIILFAVGSVLGLNRFSYVKIGVWMFIGMIYFSISALIWIVAYRKEISKPSYIFLGAITLPYFVSVKVLEASGLLDYLFKKINARARKMGAPDAKTLMNIKDFDEIDH